MIVKKFIKNHIVIPFFLLLITSVFVPSVVGWSNGGYSDNPSIPDYGTHDWIAQHALDWLPSEEKVYIENNLATYLYGTELPDNGQASDGIGDFTNHHIYYAADETLQDDSSADRALDEYNLALNYLNTNDLVNAAKRAGIMAHYIADIAVFGHVMGSLTDWGTEDHHSDYESYLNTRTNSYDDDFNPYLSYDSSLAVLSAYDAAVDLAYDTTFDVDGDLTCVWMDQNYNWNNPTFKNRCGESLNLAVNYLADVLHSLYINSNVQDDNGDTPNLNNSPGYVVINEFELNPYGNDNSGSIEEWVELYNPTAGNVDISGWKLSPTHGVTVTITLPQGTIIPANGYYVYSRGSQWLDNDDESVILRNSADTEIDRTPVKSDSDNNDWSWQRYPNGLDTNSASDWTFRSSTKGTSNGGEAPQDTTAPVIGTVGVNPGSGPAGTGFTMSVAVSDSSGVKSVIAYIQNPDETTIATVPLTDDDSDGTYTGTWSSTGASIGTYWIDIAASDNLDNNVEADNITSSTVSKNSTTISCVVSSSSLTIGNTVTVSGSITPALSGKVVTLTYTKPDSSTFTRTCTTNPGDYSDTYTPDATGFWSVIVSWNGDSNYEGASSSQFTFSVLQTVIEEPPEASFTYSPTTELSILITITFEDTSTDNDGTIVTRLWNFGNGVISNNPNPTHKYGDKETYIIQLTVTDNDGHSDTTTQSITILNLNPSANFTHEPTNPTAQQSITFTDQSEDPEGKTLTHSWNFGDEIISTENNPSHSYTEPGTYTVQLTVTDDEEAADTHSLTITVSKISTSISCSISSSEINLEDPITVSGVINPILSGKTVTLTFKKPDGSTITRTVTASSDGSYTDTYTPNADGSWSVTAAWDGDSTHDGSSSSLMSFTVKKSGCLIATATYGSELSPQVKFLRGFRDNTVYSTFAGSNFMTLFNGFYYSFSPSVASVIVNNSALKDIMKVVLYPLIGILQVSSTVFSVFNFLPELGVLVAGLIASVLIGIVYFMPIALIINHKKKFQVSEKSIRFACIVWISSVLFLVLAEIFKSPSMMMVSTGAFVLVTISTATLTSLRIVSKRLIH